MGLSNYYPSSRLSQAGVCTSSTRPASPYEGQMIYETDTDMVALWNGSAWRYIASTTATSGSVLQVVEGNYSTETGNSTTTYADTGVTATITPKSSSSKILVFLNQAGLQKASNADSAVTIRLLRGGTEIGAHNLSGYTTTTTPNSVGSAMLMVLDSPATTSATTYKSQFKNYVNASAAYVQLGNSRSSIVLMEIAG